MEIQYLYESILKRIEFCLIFKNAPVEDWNCKLETNGSSYFNWSIFITDLLITINKRQLSMVLHTYEVLNYIGSNFNHMNLCTYLRGWWWRRWYSPKWFHFENSRSRTWWAEGFVMSSKYHFSDQIRPLRPQKSKICQNESKKFDGQNNLSKKLQYWKIKTKQSYISI